MGNRIHDDACDSWYIEGCTGTDDVPRRFELNGRRLRIGRGKDADVRLPAKLISTSHAEMFVRNGALWLCDLNSTNGTFHNGEQIHGEVKVESGDLIHFAQSEYVVGSGEDAHDESTDERTEIMAREGPSAQRVSHPAKVKALLTLLREDAVVALFQPILHADDAAVAGYEILGRGNHPELPSSPVHLFAIAEHIGLAAALSDAFRRKGLADAVSLPSEEKLFINTHPTEIEAGGFLDTLVDFRSLHPSVQVVVELHEATVSSTNQIRDLRERLDELEIGLAYDDFGSGQSRLLELVEVPPDYLKFDLTLVRDIDEAPRARQSMVHALLEMARGLGIRCVAEGVERQEEFSVCRELGFDYVQGYLLGRPAPIEDWATGDAFADGGTLIVNRDSLYPKPRAAG